MNVCLVALEYHGGGHRSGFALAARAYGRALSEAGMRVTVVVPASPGQPERMVLDGVEVFSFSPARPTDAYRWLREVDADVYHSIEPSLLSHVAQRARSERAHVVTVLDPALDGPSIGAPSGVERTPGVWLTRRFYRRGRKVRQAVRTADACFVSARHLAEPVQRLYRLPGPPRFLPRPVRVPPPTSKAEIPTVCMLDRWDPEKRPELFFRLAHRFPEVRFVAAGSASTELHTRDLRRTWSHLPNLELLPPTDPFSPAYGALLSRCRVLVNPAHRTGLPASYLDAAAHGTALLSAVDPDDFASNFGVHADPLAFEEGLGTLLEADEWRKRGEMGRAYVSGTFEAVRSARLHQEAYRAILRSRAEPSPAPTAVSAEPLERSA